MSKQKNNIPVGLRLDSTNEGMMTSRRKALAMLPILREATDQAHDAEVEEFRSLLKRFGISATEYLKCKDLFDGNHTDEEIRREIQNKRV